MLGSRVVRTQTVPSARAASASLCVAVATVAAVSTLIIYAVVLARIATNAYGATGDFLSFYAAGWLVRTGRGADLYDPAVIDWAQRLLYPGGFDRAIGYPLPVFVAWVFAPFSALPFTAAFFLWMALNTALLGMLFRGLAGDLAGTPKPVRYAFIGGAALAMPTFAAIVFGQVDLIVLAGMLAGYRFLRSDRKAAGGAALALGAVKPHLLAGVLLLLLARREWKVLSVLGVLTAGLIIVPAVLTAPEALAANLRLLAAYPSSGDQLAVNAEVMPNWRGFVVSLTGRNDLALWLPGLAVLALACLAIAATRWARARDSREFDQAYSLAILFPLVASPHLHTQSLVLLLLPSALALRHAWAVSPSAGRQAAILNVMCLLFAALFFLPFFAIQGLSLTVFVLTLLYGLIALRWPRGEEPRRHGRRPAAAASLSQGTRAST
jgi:hypothetical protein